MRPLVGTILLGASLVFAGSAQALTTLTNNYCKTVVNMQWGIADQIDGTGGGALGVGSGAPYNNSLTDDSLVCIEAHGLETAAVSTSSAWLNEVANTGAHELGHLVGLEHGDGTAATLMNAAYNGTDKTFGTAAEQAVLNLNPNQLQVVWLDFQAAQPGLLPVYTAFSNSARLATLGITGAAIATAITGIQTAIAADFAGPWTGNATFSFHLTAAAANAAAGGTNYTTISFVVAPEPATGVMVLLGTVVLAGLRRRRVA